MALDVRVPIVGRGPRGCGLEVHLVFRLLALAVVRGTEGEALALRAGLAPIFGVSQLHHVTKLSRTGLARARTLVACCSPPGSRIELF